MPFTARSAPRLYVLAGLLLALALTACSATSQQPTLPTPTAAPVVLATPVPTAPPLTAVPAPPKPTDPPSPQAAVSPATAPSRLYVTNTGGQGLTLRRTPGGDPVGVLPDGTALTPTGELEQAAGRDWSEVRDGQGREGWVAVEFLSANAPAPAAPTASAPPASAPTVAAPAVAGATATPFATRAVTPLPRVTPTVPVAVPAIPPSILSPASPKPQTTPAR